MPKTDVLNVRFKVRIDNNWLFRGKSRSRLEAWSRVAKRSGLFRDPRCMQLLRAYTQAARYH